MTLSVMVMVYVLLTACGGDNFKETNILRLGLMPDIGMLPLLVAEEEGFFKDYNLSVELLVFKSAKDRDAALQAGQLNGGMSDLLAVYFYNSNNFPVKATTITESRFIILGQKDSNIDTLEKLNGIEIGLSVNTVIEYFVDSVLSDRGVKAKNLSVPQIPVRMELLRSGQLKAASLPDPLATVLIKSGATILADSQKLGIDPAVLIFTAKTINEQNTALKNLHQAYNRAVEAINKNPEKYRQLLLSRGNFPGSVIDDIPIPEFRKAELPTRVEVERILKWVEVKGLKKVDLSYKQMVQSGIF